MKTTYQPKGGMCAKCIRKHEDCSKLDFSKMKQIQRTLNTVIVKCDKYQRQSNLKTWLDWMDGGASGNNKKQK
ncbi:MAG: hypothetical protein ACRDC6_16405 [Shewanella sp.]